ncbi:MAG: PorT family protein [Sphingobacteriales bacterium]|nr:MAG: PorT family protein [Sphingobacteriales bacterium]
MKKLYTLLLISLFCNALIAQTGFKKLKYGVKGGVNMATVALSGNFATKNIKDGVSNVTSFYFGGYAELPVSKYFSVQSGLSISGKGSKTDFIVNVTVPLFGDIPANYVRETNIMYLETPLNAVFNLKNFYVGAGPYFAYGILGTEKINVSTNAFGSPMQLEPPKDGDVKFGENPGEITPYDFGANFLLGYQLKNGFNLGLNYGLGLGKTNIRSGYDVKASNRVLSVLVGFSF